MPHHSENTAKNISRRKLLKGASLMTAGGLLTGRVIAQNSGSSKQKTILAMGAHYDDCIYGIPGILLKAVDQGHRVVVVSILGDYSNWKKVDGYSDTIIPKTIELCKHYGVEKRFLEFKSMNFEVNTETQRSVARSIADVRPDIAFMLWNNDRSVPHQRAAEISKAVLLFSDYLLNNSIPVKRPREIYMYDNGPRHTIDFEPNTYVDITKEWSRAAEWLGRLMAIRDNKAFDPASA
ncbi:MAG: PIG-L family deacetylase, partial [Verrucomicrobiae bacterium]|nr:PIG-L family deacetylase [Verrucomicrobiae bacterium]